MLVPKGDMADTIARLSCPFQLFTYIYLDCRAGLLNELFISLAACAPFSPTMYTWVVQQSVYISSSIKVVLKQGAQPSIIGS